MAGSQISGEKLLWVFLCEWNFNGINFLIGRVKQSGPCIQGGKQVKEGFSRIRGMSKSALSGT